MYLLEILVKKNTYKWQKLYPLYHIGSTYYLKGDYETAIENLEQFLSVQKDFGNTELRLKTVLYLYLSYKQVGRKYDIVKIIALIKETQYIQDDINYFIYQLLEYTSYLKYIYLRQLFILSIYQLFLSFLL